MRGLGDRDVGDRHVEADTWRQRLGDRGLETETWESDS